MKKGFAKRKTIIAIATGVLVVGAGVGVLLHASSLGAVFEPQEFSWFANSQDEETKYDAVSGDGEASDLADEEETGNNGAGEDAQQILKIAQQLDPEDEEGDLSGLGIAQTYETEEADAAVQETPTPNPDIVEITTDTKTDTAVDPLPQAETAAPSGTESPAGSTARNTQPSARPGSTLAPSGTGAPTGTAAPAGTTAPAKTATPDSTQEPANTLTPLPTYAPTTAPQTESAAPVTSAPTITPPTTAPETTAPVTTPTPTQNPVLTQPPASTELPIATSTPTAASTTAPTPTPTPASWHDTQLQTKEPVLTDEGQLISLQAEFVKSSPSYYYRGEAFAASDAKVTATFEQADGTRVKKELSYGGTDGYTVKMTTLFYGENTAVFYYDGVSCNARFTVMSSNLMLKYYGLYGETVYAIDYPGSVSDDTDVVTALTEADGIYPNASGIVDLSTYHRRLIAFLGDETIKTRFSALDQYKNIVFLEEEDGYLKTMLGGFRLYQSGSLLDGDAYIYYPIGEWGTKAGKTALDLVTAVPDGYQIKRTTTDDADLTAYLGDQVLVGYTGTDTLLSVPLGVTKIAFSNGQAADVCAMQIPESVESIDFTSVKSYLPALASYAVTGTSVYKAVDGILYDADGSTLLSVPVKKTTADAWADAVGTIAEGAFAGCEMETLTLPETLTSLEAGSLADFTCQTLYLTSETLPSGLADAGYTGRVLVPDSDYDRLLKNAVFAFADAAVSVGAYAADQTEWKVGHYVYDADKDVLVESSAPDTLAALSQTAKNRVTVPDGITKVAYGAFACCDKLKHIVLPESVTSLAAGSLILPEKTGSVTLNGADVQIDAQLFGDPDAGCTVPDITVYVPEDAYESYLADWTDKLDPVYGEGTAAALLQPANGTILYEDGARYEKYTDEDGETCYTLLSVYTSDVTAFRVKEGTKKIASGAFLDCADLEILYLPDTVENVASDALSGCENLDTLIVSDRSLVQADAGTCVYDKEDYAAFVYEDGIVYGQDAEGTFTLLDVPTDYAGEVTVRANTRRIGDRAFKDCSKITAITLGDEEALQEIGMYAFSGCMLLSGTVSFADCTALTKIESYAFAECTGITSIVLPDTVTTAGEGICYGCTALVHFTAYGLTEIPDKCFYGCSALLLPKNTTNSAGGLKLTLDAITKVGDEAFAYCVLLTQMPSMPALESLGARAFYGCTEIKSAVLPETLTEMGQECFAQCGALQTVEMNGTVPGIGRYCFFGCGNLDTFSMSEAQQQALTLIGVQAFGGCRSLTTLDLSACGQLADIGYMAFADCTALTTVKLPGALKQVPDRCFDGCEMLSIVTFAAEEPTTLGSRIFGDTLPQFLHLWVAADSLPVYKAAYTEPLNADYGAGTADSVLGEIDEKVEVIAGVMFEITEEGRVLTSASPLVSGSYTIPADTVRIADEAFANCTLLTSVEFPDGSSVAIGNRCFTGCSALTEVDFYGNITDWGDETFMDCTSLALVNLGNSTKDVISRIGTRAFAGCTGLVGTSAVILYGNAYVWGEECFADCVNLKGIPMSAVGRTSITTLEDGVFKNCTSLASFLTSKFTGITSIGAYAFENCDSLKTPAVPAGVTSIGEGCFMDCDNVTAISFYCGLTEIPKDCFKNCPNLQKTGGTAAAFAALEVIGEGAYEGCVSLDNTGTWSPEKYTKLRVIGDRAFAECEKLSDMSLSATVELIANDAFDGCTGIHTLTILAETPPTFGAIDLSSMAADFLIRVPDSEADGDGIYKQYLERLSDVVGEENALQILDSVSDGAKDRNTAQQEAEE